MWVLCSSLSLGNIPSWTGFNFLLHDDREEESVDTITYLPAIDQSPTKLDVLELLVQSKCKAKKLGLKDTDVALDFAKAVEILQNPSSVNLKEFHTCISHFVHIHCGY